MTWHCNFVIGVNTSAEIAVRINMKNNYSHTERPRRCTARDRGVDTQGPEEARGRREPGIGRGEMGRKARGPIQRVIQR